MALWKDCFTIVYAEGICPLLGGGWENVHNSGVDSKSIVCYNSFVILDCRFIIFNYERA